jgi:hypothetical protein
MASIFVSYNRRSEGIAGTLVDDIERLGHTVWFDHELSGGQVWWDQILARIRDCNVFVFVLNRESLASTACKREYGYAADLGKPILPVLVSGEVSVNLLPPALTEIQFIDYIKQDREAAFRLARALTTVPPPKPLPDPLPVPPGVPVSYLGGLAEQIERASTLSYEDQSALLVDLKRGLRDPETASDSWTLLEKLRKRRDLLATIADEIDELRRTRRKTPDPLLTSATESFRHQTLQKTEGAAPQLVEAKSSEGQKLRSSGPMVVTPDINHKTTWRERVKGARNLALIGIAVGILCLVTFSLRFRPGQYGYRNLLWDFLWYLFALGGVISGAIAGMDRRGVVAAEVGMAVAAVLALIANPHYTNLFLLSALVVPPFSALIGVYISKRKSRA